MLGKILTAKAAAIAGVLVLTGGVASAATGTLPDPAQDAASSVANVVGLDIPRSGNHPDNHGKDVSGVARTKADGGDDTHGSVVCAVASQGKCQPDASDDAADDDTAGDSADTRKDGERRNENSVKAPTTTTVDETDDDSGDDRDDDRKGPASEQGNKRGKSAEHKPVDD